MLDHFEDVGDGKPYTNSVTLTLDAKVAAQALCKNRWLEDTMTHVHSSKT